MHVNLSAHLSGIAKGLNTYVNVFLKFFFLIKCAKNLKSVFALSLWSIVCILMRKTFF